MMKFGFFTIIILFIYTGLFAQNVSLDQAVQTSAQTIESRLPKGAKAAVLNFTSTSQSFADYIIDEIATALSASRNIQVIDRQHTDAIRKEFNIQFSGDVSDDEVKRIGHQLGAQYVVTGSLVDIGNAYRLRVTAINIETAVREGSSSLNIYINDPQVVFLLTGQRTNQPTTPAQWEETIYIDGFGNLRYSLSNDLGEIERAIYSRTGRTIKLNNINWRLNTALSPNVKAQMNRHNVNYSMTAYSREIIVNKRENNQWYYYRYDY